MYCPSCGTPLQTTVKFCPSCGAPAQANPAQTAATAPPPTPSFAPAQASGPIGQLQDQLASLPVVGMVQQRLSGLPVPAVQIGAGGPAAASPDFVWSAVLALGALLSIWFMRWWLIPVFLGAGVLALVYGLRPGVSLVTRSTLFIAAASVGELALVAAGTFAGTGVLGGIILMVLAGRGVWGLLKEGRPGGDTFQLGGRRLTVLIIGLAVCLFSLMFQWEPDSSYSNISLVRVGTIYKDSSGSVVHDGTWLSPRVNVSVISGENGGQVFPWLAGTAILLLVFRNKPWPKWVLGALTVFLTFMLLYGVQALGTMLGFGIMLFTGGFSAIAWSILTRKA
ncbi:MAG TPA: zinc ribbon domain-containing protein [Symbiobacteriaceae bacterium]|nr:zinc ribbon domain-containing protein [Symbiobacteriaceae bacterium]